jgi:hypothetical protein
VERLCQDLSGAAALIEITTLPIGQDIYEAVNQSMLRWYVCKACSNH